MAAKSNIVPMKTIKILKPTNSSSKLNELEHDIIYLNSEDDKILVQMDGERISLDLWKETIEEAGYITGYKNASRHWLYMLIAVSLVFIQIIFIILTYEPSYYQSEDPEEGKTVYKFLEFYLTNDLKFLP